MTDFRKLENQHGLDPGILSAVMQQESRGNVRAVSPAGAMGPFQIMPATARAYPQFDPWTVEGGAQIAARELAQAKRKYKGDTALTLAAYNAGQGNVDKAGGKIPNFPETQKYVPEVRQRMAGIDPKAVKWDDKVDQNAINPADIIWDDEQKPAPTDAAPAKPAAPEAPWMASVGRGIMDRVEGVKQAYKEAQVKLGLLEPWQLQDFNRDVTAERNAYQESAPQGIDTGRVVGGVVADAPMMALPGGPVTQAALGGALSGGLNFVPEGGSRLENAALGGLIGGGIGSVVPLGKSMFANRATDTVKRNVELARQLGINPRPSQFTKNAVAQNFENMIENMPGGASALQRNTVNNQKALNQAVSRTMGTNGVDELRPEDVASIFTQLDTKYGQALRGQKITPDIVYDMAFRNIQMELNKLPKALRSTIGQDLIRAPQLNNTMSGDSYNKIRSALGKRAVDLYRSGDSTSADLLVKIQNTMDDLAERQLTGRSAAMLKDARATYRNAMVGTAALDSETGNVSAAKLVTAAKKNDPMGMQRQAPGKTRTINDVARAASTIAKEPANSGTASRLGSGWAGYPVSSILGGFGGGLPGALAGLAVAGPGANLVGRAYLSPYTAAAARMLGEGMQDTLPAVAPLLGGRPTQY